MRLVVVTYGTEGDTRPLAALSRTLIDSGCEVTLLADGGTSKTAQDLKVPHMALAGDIRAALSQVSELSSVIGGKRSLNATTKALASIASNNASAWMRQLLEIAAGSDGIIVAGLAAYIGFSVAEKLSIPVIAAGMIPLTPTSQFPSPFVPPRSTPRWLNRSSYTLVAEMLWWAFRKSTNAARSQFGLPPGRKIWSGHPTIYGISPTLLPQPADWPQNVRMCGQWVYPVCNWDVPKSLEEFLSTGEAPIYVGFGSMVGFDQGALLGSVIEAVNGERVLFYPGWSQARSLNLPPNFFVGLLRRSVLCDHHDHGAGFEAARKRSPSSYGTGSSKVAFTTLKPQSRPRCPGQGSRRQCT